MESTYFTTTTRATTNISLPLKFSHQCYSYKRSLGKKIKARRRDYEEGRLVDENMITLRMRIRELKILETNNNVDDNEQVALPLDWIEKWETKHLLDYNKNVCEVIGFLQNYLINNRPCLGLGIVALVALSLPLSMGIFLFFVMEILYGGFHLM